MDLEQSLHHPLFFALLHPQLATTNAHCGNLLFLLGSVFNSSNAAVQQR